MQVGETPEPRLALLDGILVLLGRVPRAHDRARHVKACVVGQSGRLTQCGTRLRNGPPPERRELLLTEPVEVFILGELLRRRQRLL